MQKDKLFIILPSTLLFLVALVIYLITLCPSVYWWDSGEFITASYRLWIPHTPGFPLYVMLSKLFSFFIPFKLIAQRINLLSSLMGSLSLVYLFLLFNQFVNKEKSNLFHIFSGIFGSLILLFSVIFWSQSIIASVFIINLPFLLASGYYFLLYQDSPEIKEKYLYLSGLILGLGLSVHEEMLLLIPGLLIITIFSPVRKRLAIKQIVLFLAFVILGLLLYLYIPLRSSFLLSFNWGGLETWDKFHFYITHSEFKYKIFSRSYYAMGILALVAGKELIRNFTWVGILLGILGMISLFRKRALYFSFTFSIVVLNLLLALVYGYSQRFEEEFSCYFLPAYSLFSLYIGLGIYGILGFLEKKIHSLHNLKDSKLKFFCLLPFFFFLLFLIHRNHPIIADIKKDFPRKYGYQILNDIPKDSVVVVGNVFTDFITLYLQQVEGYRKDIHRLSLNLDNNIPTDWKEWMKLGSQGKPVYLEYDTIARYHLENYFYPSVYFGKLTDHPVQNFQLQDLPNQDSQWEKMIQNMKLKKVSYKPIIIDSFHPFALARHNLSVLYAKRGLWQKAFAESYSASEYELNYSEPYLTRGIWNLNLNHPDKAKAELETYTRLNPISHDGWLNLGTANAQLNLMNNALVCYNRALKINSQSAQAYANLGLVYMNKMEYYKAEKEFRNAISINPNNPTIWIQLAHSLESQGNTFESKKAWQRVLDLDSNNSEAKEALENLK